MTRWMIPLSFIPQKTDWRPHPSKREMTGQPGSSRTLRRRPSQPPHPRRLRATDDRPSRYHDKKSTKTVSSSMSVVDRSSWSDGPSGTRGSDRHRSYSDERGHRDHCRGSERRHESPRARHSPRRCESEERTPPSSSS